MRILLIYSSTEGHTEKIVNFLADQLTTHYTVEVTKASVEAPSPATFDAVIVAAPIHAGQYANEISEYITKHVSELNRVPTLFYSIGLTVTSKDPEMRNALNETTTSFLKSTKWNPEVIEQIAGALLYTRYGFFKKMLMKSIMKKAGGDTDIKKDFVYTDWNALKASVHRFANQFEMMEH
jgi:menaquinone-dependent protoporphyrinogen oxidase